MTGRRVSGTSLTPMERKVLVLIGGSFTNIRIAELLSCTEANVKGHTNHLHSKLTDIYASEVDGLNKRSWLTANAWRYLNVDSVY